MNVIVRIEEHVMSTTLSEFLVENHDGMTDEERDAIRTCLKSGDCYHGGGGALPEWTIEPC